jgi:syntaxin-binding protein 1
VTVTEQRQRIIVFIAGGATYSESRSCYEISKKWNRDVILGSTEMLTPTSFISELARSRESRQNLNLAMDQTRAMPRHHSDHSQHQRPLQATPSQGSLPSRPSQGRMGPPQNIPSAMRPGSGHGSQSRNGIVGGPRPIPGQPRSPPQHVAHGPGHATPPATLGPQHRQPASKDNKDGDKKEKKKKKFGMF